MKTKQQVNETREAIAALWVRGHTVSQIARELGVSRPTVYKVISRLDDPETTIYDAREKNPGRPQIYDTLTKIVAEIRAKHPEWGPMFIRDYIKKNNLMEGEKLPSLAEIARTINELGLARKPVGPRDNRAFPAHRPTRSGTATIDMWGPWHIRASRVYLATIQDRWTRLALGVPAFAPRFSDGGAGLSENTWATAIMCYSLFLSNRFDRLFTDNGLGMCPAGVHLPMPVRLALALGAVVTYIPPAQPWRNGKLERFHWTMTREFWARERPQTTVHALEGFVEYLNWYNHERIHSSLSYHTPASVAEAEEIAVPRLKPEFWREAAEALKHFEPPPLRGTVEAIRLVKHGGLVELWGNDTLVIPQALAGQYVRVEFLLSEGEQVGRAVWRNSREEITVAEFIHHMGQAKQSTLISRVRWREFAEEDVPRNEDYDETQAAFQKARITRGKSAKRS